MITVMSTSRASDRLQTARALLLGIVCARSSFEPHPSEDPGGPLFVSKPADNRRRQALREQPRQEPRDATNSVQRQSGFSSRHLGDSALRGLVGPCSGPHMASELPEWDTSGDAG